MPIKNSILAVLPLLLLLSACSTTPESDTGTSGDRQTSKGQAISKCLDHSSPDECYKKYDR